MKGGWTPYLETVVQRPLCVILFVVALQVGFFSISWNQFFCGDSLYYLSRQTHTWTQVQANFLREDDVAQYRPLTYPVFTYLFYPVGGLTPRVYHWIGLAIHALVSLALFWLLNEMLRDWRAAVAGYLFFALHCVAYFITYDVTFLSDWLFAAFLLAMLVCYLKFLRTRRRIFYLAAFLLFPLALLSKETAVMAPVALFGLCMVESLRVTEYSGGEKAWKSVRAGLGTAIRQTALFASVSVLYVGLLILVKGRLYPEAPTHPFHLSLGAANLALNHRFLLWSINIDFKVPLIWTDWLFFLVYVPQAALALWIAHRLWKNRQVWQVSAWLLLWGFALLFPVLLLVEPPYPHHLYMPLAAWSGAVGMAFMKAPGEQPWGRRLVVVVLCLNLVSSYLSLWRFNQKSWVAHGSMIAGNFLTSLKRHHPTLQPNSVIHLRKTKEPNSIWYFDRHSLVQLFYGDPSLAMRFEDLGEKLPPQSDPPVPNYFIYGMWEGNLDLLSDYWKGSSIELLDWALQGEVTEDRSQYYPRFDRFMTPGGGRLFHHYLIKQGERRRTLVTIAGTRLKIPLPYVQPGSKLHVGLASVYDEGDGFAARLSMEYGGKQTVLIDRYIDSLHRPQDRGWLDYHLDLNRFVGSDNFLILECNAGPWGKTEADWLAWSMLKINREQTD